MRATLRKISSFSWQICDAEMTEVFLLKVYDHFSLELIYHSVSIHEALKSCLRLDS